MSGGRTTLAAWASSHLGEGPVRVHGAPTAAGRSSDTLLFDVGTEGFVLRRPPATDAFPLFPHYDLGRQAAAMRLVAERTEVPVPVVRWYEPDPSVLGTPFLVMERVEGVPAPDQPPYVFGSWLTEASPEQLGVVEAGMVEVLSGIHTVTDVEALELDVPGDTPLRRHVEHWRRYHRWVAEQAGTAFPVVDAAFDWLERRWPVEEGAPCLGWGDARLANVLFRDFRPVAVLDWEAAAPGPPELDVGWCLFFHQYFQRVAVRYGYPGIPDLLATDRFVGAYERATGHVVRDLDWFLVYAELRQAITSIRVSGRAVQVGDRAAPDDPQDLIIDRAHLEELIA
jgi:aminoglycoside phosphotransferase (APT) family kinase protein